MQRSEETESTRFHLLGKVIAVFLSLASGPAFGYGLTIGPNNSYSLAAGTTDLDCGDLIVQGTLNLDSGTMDRVRAVLIEPGGIVNGGTGTVNKSGILTNQGTFNEQDVQVNYISDCAAAASDSRATFTVQKQFVDLNDNVPVTVHLDCNTGLILDQEKTVMTDNNGQFEVEFVVTDFTQGAMSCEIWEEAVPGYSASYAATSNIGTVTSDSESDPAVDGCRFENLVTTGAELVDWQNECVITNTPDYQTVTINKEWILGMPGAGAVGDSLDPGYTLELTCNGEIEGVDEYYGKWTKTFENTVGTENYAYTAQVMPSFPNGTACWVEERLNSMAVEVTNECGNSAQNAQLLVTVGQGDTCTITNTVFFEGIPTLNQYTLAILALLMLGMGFVGIRRYV